jgi:hypothetical protein
MELASGRTCSWWENLLLAAGVEGSNSDALLRECALDCWAGSNGLGEGGCGLGGECALGCGSGKAGLPQDRWADDGGHCKIYYTDRRVIIREEKRIY